MRPLTYPQWFALLVLRCFSPERPGRAVRLNTLRSLASRGLAIEDVFGQFWITRRGVEVEDSIKQAPR